MTRRLLTGLLLLALAGPAAPGLAGPRLPGAGLAVEPEAPFLLDAPLTTPLLGNGIFGVDVDVARYRLLDPGAAISVDLNLRWPTAPDSEAPPALQPHLSVGPALFLSDPGPVPPTGPGGDASAVLGVKAGAGVTWRLDRRAALFGEYRVTRGGVDALAPLGGGGRSDVGGFDLLYGLRLRF